VRTVATVACAMCLAVGLAATLDRAERHVRVALRVVAALIAVAVLLTVAFRGGIVAL
jgi:hypothetical protein